MTEFWINTPVELSSTMMLDETLLITELSPIETSIDESM